MESAKTQFNSSQSSNQTLAESSPSIVSAAPVSDEINLLEYIYVLAKRKWWIIGSVIIGLLSGYGLAIIKGPTWISEVVIAAKESDSPKMSNIAGFGAFGGIVASQLNIAVNPGLDKIDLILGSRKFGSEVIEMNNLLPLVYKNSWPKEYRKYFNTLKNSWSENFVEPNPLKIGGHIRKEYLKKVTNKNNTMNIRFESKDSLFSDTLLSLYLNYLNSYIQTSVQTEARENLIYLENQLMTTSDPLLREKLQSMIASEVEKSMLVSNEAFKIVDPQYTFKDSMNKKIYPLAFSSILFILTTFIIIFHHTLTNKQRTGEDEKWIKGIRREMIRF